jgi:carbon storage regulator
MLVMSRKKNEAVIINDEITVVVVEIRGDKVRLGIEAPKETPVIKSEVFDAIRRNSPDRADGLRYQIDGLKSKIRDLESELSLLTPGKPDA